MPVTISFPFNIEKHLQDEAGRQGVSLEEYITQFVISRLSVDPEELTEDELLHRVQLNVQPRELDEYYRLVDLRKAEQMSEDAYERLLELTNRMEIAHADQMKYVIVLAKLRGVSLEQIMLDLGFQKKVG